MMAGQLDGMNLSGLSGLSMFLCGGKLNGKLCHENLCFPKFVKNIVVGLWYSHVLCAARWYAKRFLHPDIIAPYDYIFIWDEDLGVENFDFEE